MEDNMSNWQYNKLYATTIVNIKYLQNGITIRLRSHENTTFLVRST